MGYTERFTEVHELLATIYAANVAAVQDSGFVSFRDFHRGVIIIHPLVLTGALDVDIEQGTTTAGAGIKTFDAGGKDIAVQQADTAPSVIEIRSEEFDVDGGFDCLNVEVTPAGQGEYFVVEIWGCVPRFADVSTALLDSVTD